MECDWPQLVYYEELYEQYDNALFIMMKRNVTEHVLSMINWGNMRQRFVERDIPYLPLGVGGGEGEMRRWIEGHYERVREFFEDKNPDQYLEYDLNADPIE